jgi:hypothetical protein
VGSNPTLSATMDLSMLKSAVIPLVLLAIAAALLPGSSAFAGDPVNSRKPDASAAAVKSLIQELGAADTVELRLLSPLKSYAMTFAVLEPAEGRALSDSCIYRGNEQSDIAALIDILNTSVTRMDMTPTNFGGEFYWTLIFKKHGSTFNRLFVRAGVSNGSLTGVLDGGQFDAVPGIADRLEAWANRPNLILARNVEGSQDPQYGKGPAVADGHGRKPCTKWKG